MIWDHTDSSPPKKKKDRRKDHLPWQLHVLVFLVQLMGKKKQTDPHGEDRKEKQDKLGMNIQNVYISVWNTNVSEYNKLNSLG